VKGGLLTNRREQALKIHYLSKIGRGEYIGQKERKSHWNPCALNGAKSSLRGRRRKSSFFLRRKRLAPGEVGGLGKGGLEGKRGEGSFPSAMINTLVGINGPSKPAPGEGIQEKMIETWGGGTFKKKTARGLV